MGYGKSPGRWIPPSERPKQPEKPKAPENGTGDVKEEDNEDNKENDKEDGTTDTTTTGTEARDSNDETSTTADDSSPASTDANTAGKPDSYTDPKNWWRPPKTNRSIAPVVLSITVVIILAASALIYKFWRKNIVRRLSQLGIIRLPEDLERRKSK